MKQYLELLQDIKSKCVWKEPARENMPRTKSLFGTQMKFDLSEGFPLLTTKKMYFKGVVTELLWFLKGDTNIKYLVDNGCNIWNQDAYRWYLKKFEFFSNGMKPLDIETFLKGVKERWTLGGYTYGDLGKVYGHQWRNQNGVDQLADIVQGIQDNPYSRYHILDGWNKADFSEMALPPCHLLYQFNCRKNDVGNFVLDLQMYQRSCDTFLGVPFNIASASLLLMIVAEVSGMIPGEFTWVGGDTHIYENHLDQIEEQLTRDPKPLPKVHIVKTLRCLQDIELLKPEDIVLSDYDSHPKIKGVLSAGL